MHPIGSIFFWFGGCEWGGVYLKELFYWNENNKWPYICIYKALQIGSQSWITTFLPISLKWGKFVNASKIANDETN